MWILIHEPHVEPGEQEVTHSDEEGVGVSVEGCVHDGSPGEGLCDVLQHTM